MDQKQQALDYIKNLGASHSITRIELIAAFDAGAGPPPVETTTQIPATETHKFTITNILYYLGGAIVFIGISIFIQQNWVFFSFLTKIAATLGGAVAAYVTGVILSSQKYEGPGNAFFFISALVMPLGLYVFFDNYGFSVGIYATQSLISAILFVVYLLSFFLYRRAVFVLFSIIFGTWFFYAITGYLVSQNIYFDTWKFFEYRTLLSGICYILLGHALSNTSYRGLVGTLYGFGSLGLLGAALMLGGWHPNQNMFWELIYPLMVFGILYVSVYLKSKSFLVFGTIFLMAYIFKITSEYFTVGLGWPLALVVAGLLMIAVGYISVTINKKYITDQ